LQNFIAAIGDGVPLIAPGSEGIHSVTLANAMVLSTWLERTIDLPFDAALFERALQQRITGASAADVRAADVRAADVRVAGAR
jgi:hypothetical protein